MSAAELKSQGNDAFKAGRYADAIESYTEALTIEPRDKSLLHNRALCYLQLGQFQEALDGATEAIVIDSRFVKAYSTKGTALLRLGRRAEALAAYRGGLAIDPRHEGCLSGVQSLETDQARPRPQYAANQADPDFPPVAPAVPEEPLTPGTLHSILRSIRLMVLLGLVLYLASPGSFWMLLAATGAAHALAAIIKFGVPSVSNWRQWMERATLDSAGLSAIVPATLLVLRRPNVMALVASQAPVDAWYALEQIHGSVQSISPALAGLLGKAGQAVLPALLGQSSEQLAGQSRAVTRAAILERLLYMSATSYLGVGLLLVLELVTPYRNLLGLVMLGQSMQLMFVMSPYSRKACRAVDGTVRGLLGHRMVPPAVLAAYDKLSTMMYEMAARPMRQARETAQGQAQGQAPAPGGLMGSLTSALGGGCTIQ